MEKETQQISQVLNQADSLSPLKVLPGNFDYYRAQLTDEQYQQIYDKHLQARTAIYLQSVPLDTDLASEEVTEALKSVCVDLAELIPDMKKLAQKLEGDANNREYAKIVYADWDKGFKHIRYDLRQMQMYLEYYFFKQGIEFKLTPEYYKVYKNLCKYFCDDESFDGDLSKGLWLYGCVGDGKTSIMKAFVLNQKESFRVVSVADIAEDYKENGAGILKQYSVNTKRPINPFGQSELALCLDDVGTEDIYKNYGDPLNVVERIILKRYASGLQTHFTTNINTAKVQEIYGERAVSRLRQMVNIIELPEVDLRK